MSIRTKANRVLLLDPFKLRKELALLRLEHAGLIPKRKPNHKRKHSKLHVE